MGNLLKCAKSIKQLDLSCDDFGECCHDQSTEPFFYNSSYTMVKHATIAVDSNGRCVIPEEIGKRDPTTNRPNLWKCTPECKVIMSQDMKTIMATKVPFDDKPLHVLSRGLKSVDEFTEHGHYTQPMLLQDEESDSEDGEHSQVHIDYDQKPYYELAGHPLLCSDNNSMCQSRLRVLRAAAPHFPQLCKFLFLLYNTIREHSPLDSIDMALCAGDFEELCQLCGISDYTCLISTVLSSGSCVEDAEEPRSLQQPKLPDLESDLHVTHG